jgi:hypothetical protein
MFGSNQEPHHIPDQALRSQMESKRTDTKRAANVRVVEEFNRRWRMARLTLHAGTFKDFMTQADLGTTRHGGKRP